MADTPTTEAGKRLLERVTSLNGRAFPLATAADIAAIEAEARADVLRELRAEVETLASGYAIGGPECKGHVYRQAVLRAIDARLNAQPEPVAGYIGSSGVGYANGGNDLAAQPEPAAPEWEYDPNCTRCFRVEGYHDGPHAYPQPEPSAPEGLDVERLRQAWLRHLDRPAHSWTCAPACAPDIAAAYREATRQEPTFIGSEFCAPHYHVAGPNDACGECGHDLRALCHHREATR